MIDCTTNIECNLSLNKWWFDIIQQKIIIFQDLFVSLYTVENEWADMID